MNTPIWYDVLLLAGASLPILAFIYMACDYGIMMNGSIEKVEKYKSRKRIEEIKQAIKESRIQ